MKRKTVILMTIMLTSATLSGCAGNEAQLEETIDSLEQQAIADQERMSDLEQQAIADQERIANLDSIVSTLDGNLALMNANIDSLKADLDIAYSEGYAAGTADAAGTAESSAISTLDTVLERGSLKCGVKEGQYGMAYLDYSTGVRSGLDISYCRAVAAAIGLNPDTDVEYIPASGSNRFQMLFDETIDVLIRTTTWTATRDAALDADFAAVNFYDGQGMLVREDRFDAASAGNSVSGLSGASICVGSSTTSEGNLVDYFNTHGISFNSISANSGWDAVEMLKDGTCDAFTGDTSAMIAVKWELENSDDHADWRDSSDHTDVWVPVELLSKEPLAAVTRDYDTEWNEIVSWVWYGAITAEELGVTSLNYDLLKDYSCDGGAPTYNVWICRLLTENFGLGTETNPLSNTWMQDVLENVGNYGEMYDDAFCDGTYDGASGSDAMTGCLMSRSGTLNALVSEGGIQYAPSMR
tara:strand:- start:265 stop:1671 length:1407 start_codon:yes stop_codon:yes gene_type:complete